MTLMNTLYCAQIEIVKVSDLCNKAVIGCNITFVGNGLLLGVCQRIPSSARERAFFRLAKTAKQAMLVPSSIQPDAGRRKISRSKPDRVL